MSTVQWPEGHFQLSKIFRQKSPDIMLVLFLFNFTPGVFSHISVSEPIFSTRQINLRTRALQQWQRRRWSVNIIQYIISNNYINGTNTPMTNIKYGTKWRTNHGRQTERISPFLASACMGFFCARIFEEFIRGRKIIRWTSRERLLCPGIYTYFLG